MTKEIKLNIVWLDPNDLTPYVNNTKLHPTEQIDKIAQQIAKFGFDQPLTVDKDKVIITGHGRRLASIRLGLKAVPVIIRDDLNEHEVMARRIADNKVAESEWDNEMLRFELGTLARNDSDLLDYVGFDDSEIKKILDEEEAAADFGGAGNGDNDPTKQYIVSVECKNEDEMATLYQELKGRGLNVTLIT